MSEGVNLQLYFGRHLIGEVSDTHHSELNWYGTWWPADSIPPRIREFISFCIHWHARAEAGKPYDPDEFAAWRDVEESGEWWTKAPDGTVMRITAPFFWEHQEICWREPGGPQAGPPAGQPRD